MAISKRKEFKTYNTSPTPKPFPLPHCTVNSMAAPWHFPKGHAEHTDKVQQEIKKKIFKRIGYGPVTALVLTVSPTLLPSAFYRECQSYKIPQIHCSMVHTALLCVVQAKLLSISTWGKAAALMARESNILPCNKMWEELEQRTDWEFKKRKFWLTWIFVPQRAAFYVRSPHVLIPCSQTLSCVSPMTKGKPRGHLAKL